LILGENYPVFPMPNPSSDLQNRVAFSVVVLPAVSEQESVVFFLRFSHIMPEIDQP